MRVRKRRGGLRVRHHPDPLPVGAVIRLIEHFQKEAQQYAGAIGRVSYRKLLGIASKFGCNHIDGDKTAFLNIPYAPSQCVHQLAVTHDLHRFDN